MYEENLYLKLRKNHPYALMYPLRFRADVYVAQPVEGTVKAATILSIVCVAYCKAMRQKPLHIRLDYFRKINV